MPKARLCLCTLLVLVALLVPLSTPAAADEVVALRAARVLDVESGRMLEDAVVVVEGERIREIADSAPAGARVVDLGDRTLLPGLIDLHTHLAYSLEGDWVGRAVRERSADAAFRAAQNARTTLAAGFTTVRDVGSGDFVDVSLQRAIDAGLVEGPRVIPSGHALGITGGHCDTTGFAPGLLERGPEAGIADGVDEVTKAVRYQIKHGAQWIKACATAGVLSFEASVGAQQFTDEELTAIVEEAARHHVKVAAHAHGTEGILAAVRAGVASIEHGSMLSPQVLQEMKEHGTYLVPTTYLADAIDLENLPPPIRAKAESILPRAKKSLEDAIRAGVNIAFGTDAAVYPHGLNAREFAVLVERGMTPLEAIRTATVNATALLGLDDRGLVAAGRLADLIAVSGNPLEEIRTLEDVEFVMKGGKIFLSP